MDQQPWAIFSEVVEQVTSAPIKQVQISQQSIAAHLDARMAWEFKAVRKELKDLTDSLERVPATHRRGMALPWILAAVLGVGDLYFVALMLYS